MSEKIEVVCLGILVVDILCSPIDKVPEPGELISTDEISLSGGGHAHNAAVSLARLGLKVGALGKVGYDHFGDFLKEDLRKEGVDISKIAVSHKLGTSKTMIILTHSEDRRFIHTLGANADFNIDDIDFNYLSQGKVLYVGGYGVLPELEEDSLTKLLKFAKLHGLITVLDVVIPHTEVRWINKCKRALEFTDFFLPNSDEARLITGRVEPREQAKEMLRHNYEMTVVITMGKGGSFVRTKDKIARASTYEVEVVDPSGGGDAFSAGFIFGVVNGWELEETLKLASAMGASAVREVGTTTGVFTRSEAEKFIKNNEIELGVQRCSLCKGE
ncbi:MAG: carbohydrate kinase family protein [Candidatus Aerophobus sp.]|nr:MAG: carbohydrate kinase family protein [Candidatus Aerophobus sp.]